MNVTSMQRRQILVRSLFCLIAVAIGLYVVAVVLFDRLNFLTPKLPAPTRLHSSVPSRAPPRSSSTCRRTGSRDGTWAAGSGSTTPDRGRRSCRMNGWSPWNSRRSRFAATPACSSTTTSCPALASCPARPTRSRTPTAFCRSAGPSIATSMIRRPRSTTRMLIMPSLTRPSA